MNKIYISGPITQSTDEDKGKQRFKDMVLKIHNMGIGIPISPRAHRMPPWFKLPEDSDKVWTYMMKLALKDLMEADSMVLLDGWEKSPGCTIEVELCKLLDIPVFDEHFKTIHSVGDSRGILHDLGFAVLRPDDNNNSKQAILLTETDSKEVLSPKKLGYSS